MQKRTQQARLAYVMLAETEHAPWMPTSRCKVSDCATETVSARMAGTWASPALTAYRNYKQQQGQRDGCSWGGWATDRRGRRTMATRDCEGVS